jgi:hypothetical protein
MSTSEGFWGASLGLRLTVILALVVSVGVWGVGLHALLRAVGAI